MAALADREKLAAKVHHAGQLPPVAKRAAQRRMVGPGPVETDAVIDFRKGRGDGGDIAAMAVPPIDAFKAVAGQRLRQSIIAAIMVEGRKVMVPEKPI